jgi:2-iminobutanoate/2-iminopropanoate deaminase
MTRQQGQTEQAPRPAGPYSQSVRIGQVVAAAGQIGADPAGEVVGPSVGDQTRQALRNVEAALGASGASLDNVIRVGVFLTNVEDFAAMNEVYGEFFSDPYPARTTVFVTLAPGAKVEIDALAVVP